MSTTLLFSVRSDLYRAVAAVRSKEETRYYLGGVHIEPHPVEGVILVATDGHRLMAAHDIDGICASAMIVNITGSGFKAGKAKRTDNPTDPRRFTAATESAVSVAGEDYDCAWRIDGTFPDWRRVLPRPDKVATKTASPTYFNPRYLADFATVTDELLVEKPVMLIQSTGAADPALVTFNHADIFGVIMPVKADHIDGYPYFMNPKYRKDAAA